MFTVKRNAHGVPTKAFLKFGKHKEGYTYIHFTDNARNKCTSFSFVEYMEIVHMMDKIKEYNECFKSVSLLSLDIFYCLKLPLPFTVIMR